VAGHGLPLLESALPAWLPRQRWFGAKSRKILHIKVLDWVELPVAIAANTELLSTRDLPDDTTIPSVLLYVEVNYGDNQYDVYQVPLAFSTGATAQQVQAERPGSVIATLHSPVGPGVVHDATGREDFRQALLSLVERDATLDLATTWTAAIEVAASLASAATGQPAREAAETGQAEELLEHPERATHGHIAPGMVHLRPHEVFPGEPGAEATPAPPATSEDRDAFAPHPLAGLAVEPLPLTAQPGEAAAQPRSDTPASGSASGSGSQRFQPRESPSAGIPHTEKGRLEARASAVFSGVRGDRHLPARVGSAEQSNTSVLYGKQVILKLFRRLQSGENPDVEIGRFLTEVAHFGNIPPFLGKITITPTGGETTTVAMLQGLVENEGDGWEWFLDGLQEFFASVLPLAAPPDAQSVGFAASASGASEAVRSQARATLEAAALLGRRTAEMHLALATPSDDPAFSPEPLTAEDLSRDALRIQDQLHTSFEALRGKLASLPEELADEAAGLLARRRALLARARAVAASDPSGNKIRIHGDYHLGQTLRTGAGSGDFMLLDFEGEPARSLAERRRKQCPLKDVAGMIRSFSYAAFAALDRFRTAHPDRAQAAENLANWAHAWENAAAAEFLSAYRRHMASAPGLLPAGDQADSLFSAYVLEKALYELLYELNNRPAWVRIPLDGMLYLTQI
ncbi:MAG TPA: putative maltokinase, partial [Steroidobacteraceae bacterium]|nr:putative maltokinase [Steroidobacteraceae bacterium]